MDFGPFVGGSRTHGRYSDRPRTAGLTAKEAGSVATCPGWVKALVVAYRDEAHFLDQLDQAGATASTRRFVRKINQAHAELKHDGKPGVWESLATISKNTSMPVTTIRKSLKQLGEMGCYVEEKVIVDGRFVTMRWWLWLLPLEGSARAKNRVPSDKGRAQKGAPFCNTYYRNRSSLKKKTTDRVDAGSSSLSAPPPGKEIPKPATIPSPPEPALPPAIAATIEAEVDELPDRLDLAASVPAWIAESYPIEWVVFAILEAAAARQARANSARPVHSLAAFAEGMLGNWRRDGAPSLRSGRKKLPPSGKTPEMARSEAREDAVAREAKVRQEAEAERARLAEAEAIRVRWESLPAEDRADIEARVDAENPHVRRFKSMRGPLLHAAMADRERCLLAR